jgi:hypothetical protein
MKFRLIFILTFLLIGISQLFAQELDSLSEDLPRLGLYQKINYSNPKDLSFKALKSKLPKPIVADKVLLEMYYKAWENAFKEIETPKGITQLKYAYLKPVDSTYLSLWHTEMSMHFWKYGINAFNASQAIDNFLDLQQMDGYIGRQVEPKLGNYYYAEQRKVCSDPPLLAWAEWEWYKHTGDSLRAKRVTDPLSFQVEWLELNKALPNEANNCYFWNTQTTAGIAGIPRSTVSQIDAAAQVVLNYNYAYKILGVSKNTGFQESYLERINQLKKIIGTQFYDPKRNLFTDLNAKRKPETTATINGFWTLLAEIPSEKQKTLMLRNLENQNTWNTPYFFPVIAIEKGVNAEIPSYGELNFMVIEGLKAIGKTTLAHNFANKLIDNQLNSFKKTKKLFSHYNSQTGEPAKGSSENYTLGSALVAINLLIQDYLGFEVEGNKQQLNWNLSRTDAHGIENLLVGNTLVNIKTKARANANEPVKIKGTSNGPFALYLKVGDKVFYKQFEKGKFSVNL